MLHKQNPTNPIYENGETDYIYYSELYLIVRIHHLVQLVQFAIVLTVRYNRKWNRIPKKNEFHGDF